MKLLRTLIVFTLAVSAYGVARVSSTEELKRLARLPKLELAAPLDYSRQTGFVIFPDSRSLNAEAKEIQKRLNEKNSSPAPDQWVRLGEIYDQLGNYGLAIRFYRRAIDEYRRQADADPGDAEVFAELGRVLSLTGKFGEAFPAVQRAVTLAPEKASGWLAMGVYYRERVWRIITSETAMYGNISFLDALHEFMVMGAEPGELEEADELVALAVNCFDKAVAADPKKPEVFAARGAFRAFASVLRTAFTSMQNNAPLERSLQASLLPAGVVEDFTRAAELDAEDPARLALAAFLPVFANLYAEHLPEATIWQMRAPSLPPDYSPSISWAVGRLRALADSENQETAASAAEMLGCVQLLVFHDSPGGVKSLQAALAADPERDRAWDLLILELNRRGDYPTLVERCSERVLTSPSVRNYLFLAKAFERMGDYGKAEWITLTALAASQKNFFANLALANLLLKRPDHQGFLGRIGECIRQAEGNMGPNPSAQNHLDLALTKALYLALSDQAEEARELLKKTERTRGRHPEITAALKAIGY